MRTIKLIVFFIILSVSVYAQNPVFVNVQYLTGKVMPHREGMDILKNGFVKGFELEVGKQMADNKNWQVVYNYPMVGVGLHYDYLNNPEILGTAIGLYGFVELPVFRTSQFELMYRLTSGLTYVSKRYDEKKNQENTAISTRVSYLFHTGFRARYWVNTKNALGVGFGLTHYSNGGTSIPNRGLNQWNATVGLTHYFTGEYNDFSDVRRPIDWNPYHEIYLLGNYGWVSIPKNRPENAGTNQTFPTASLSLGYNYRYAAQRKLGFSLDAFYNESFNWTYWDGFINYHFTWTQLTRLGLGVNHEFVFNRLSIFLGGGVYLKPYKALGGTLSLKANEWFYERLGFRYYPIDNMFLNVSVKAYGFKAETIELGVGFSLRKYK